MTMAALGMHLSVTPLALGEAVLEGLRSGRLQIVPASVELVPSGMLTKAQAATRLGKSVRWIERAIKSKKLVAERAGRTVQIRPAAIDRMLERTSNDRLGGRKL